MGKIVMADKIKKIAIIGCIILSLVCVGVIVSNLNTTEKIKEEKILYDYKMEPSLDYNITFSQNPVYETAKMNSEQSYIAQFIKYIEVNLGINIEGSKKAQISGEYEVIADLNGYTMQDEKKVVIWNKHYTVKDKKPFKVEDDKYSIQETAKVDYKIYDQFIKDLQEQASINTAAEISVGLKGNIKIEVEGKIVERPLDLKLNIPLNQSYISLVKQNNEVIQDQIKEEVEKEVPVSKVPLLISLLGILISGAALTIIIFRTQPLSDQRNREIKVNKLLKEYGSRMVGVKEIHESLFPQQYQVLSMEDMIKIADEKEEPILYIRSLKEEEKDIESCYIISGDRLFIYRVQ